MTTITLNGYKFFENEFVEITSYGPTTLTWEFAGSPSGFTYSYINPPIPLGEFPPFADIETTLTDIKFDGVSAINDPDFSSPPLISLAQTPTTSTVLLTYIEAAGNTSYGYVFELGGDPILAGFDAESYNELKDDPDYSSEKITTGTFAPGTFIPFSAIGGAAGSGGDGGGTAPPMTGAGDDEVFGGPGADTIDGGAGNDTIYGQDGGDQLTGGAGEDVVYGGNGPDVVRLGAGDDIFNDNAQGAPLGNDTVYGDDGADSIIGAGGDDAFYGNQGQDRILGGGGNDALFGGNGADALFGGNGADTIDGGRGRDEAFLGNGSDVYRDNGQGGGAGRDTVYGGNGNDTIQGGGGADEFNGGRGKDLIYGRNGADELNGNGGSDTIYAGNGADDVEGGFGRDRVFLGNGADTYEDADQSGPGGSDTITGGNGADTFIFDDETGADVITDFEIGVDTLELSLEAAGGRSAAQVVSDLASVTGTGVEIDLGDGNTITLNGLTSTAGLASDIDIL
ncbi:calcium-binding protein [Pseudaestuariivita sp.]|uniref:calcium-binding protein n=1 Tax=Pseudaestuariivita sp. TaxID=2211669 RepID=UPI00405A2414